MALLLHFSSSRSVAFEPLVTNFGLGTIVHPLEEPGQVRYPACYHERPCRCLKEHVYVFGINGLNPLCIGNFNGLCAYLKKQGFTNMYFGQLYGSEWFSDEIRKIRREDPNARIALIGYSLGANYVRTMANDLAQDGTKIDLLLYLVGDYVFEGPDAHPPNVTRLVNVRAQGLLWTGGDLFFNGANLPTARNVKLNHRHILIPSRRDTVELMMEELLMLACFPLEPAEQEATATQTTATKPATVQRTTQTAPRQTTAIQPAPLPPQIMSQPVRQTQHSTRPITQPVRTTAPVRAPMTPYRQPTKPAVIPPSGFSSGRP